MPEELAYVIITPHSLQKSRTGGIIARLITRTGLELVGARMFAPGAQLAQEYADAIVSADDPQDRRIQELIRDYVLQNIAPDPKTHRRRRVMVLLLRGDESVQKVRSVVGNIRMNRLGGETIRDTYGDLIISDDGQVRYFEPAVLVAPNVDEAKSNLRIWAKHSDSDGGLLENIITYQPGERPERTLVLIKPDNFRFPTARPGNVIDFFSRTGLFIVAIKVHRMSVSEAIEFYGPVRGILCRKSAELIGARAKLILEKELGFRLPDTVEKQLGQIIGPLFGENQFENIIKFMSGRYPSQCDKAERDRPGSETCIALVYEGVGAVHKIRDVLGPTDPAKAPPGSIRREFGQSIMVNAAHASDSEENARREMQIVRVAENNFRQVIEEFCGPA
jgi:nucleoside diphosphate kinase